MSEKKWPIEKVLSLITVFTILLIPTIGLNMSSGKGHPIIENSYMWPWMILVYFKPIESVFSTEMYNIVLPPWTFLIFAPFLFGFRLAYIQFQMNEPPEKTAGLLALIAVIQIFLIWLTYQSQESLIGEDVTMLYLPQLLILLLQGSFGAKWYYKKVDETLKSPPSPEEKKAIKQEKETS